MAQTKIEQHNADNKVMVWSKSYFPFAKATKDLLTAQGIDFKAYELDKEADGQDIQNTLKTMSGQGTVPNVYINNKHVGGNSDLQALHTAGKLASTVNP